MKKFWKVFGILVGLYVVGCILVSCSYNSGNFDVLERRAPFIVVETSIATIERVEEDGKLYAYDENGFYTAYNSQNFSIGETVQSTFVYNPFSNYTDDIILRFDRKIKGE